MRARQQPAPRHVPRELAHDAGRRVVARFKQPKRIFIIDELPRNTMGKVQKNVLRDRFKDVFAS